MKKTYLQKGFTLIELLVVISIIGLLSSVVLAALTNARRSGADGAIKQNLINARTVASLYLETTGGGTTFAGVCTATVANHGIGGMVLAAAKDIDSAASVDDGSNNFSYFSTGAQANQAICKDQASGWAAIVSLKNPITASSGWCVDSKGASKEETSLPKGSFSCP